MVRSIGISSYHWFIGDMNHCLDTAKPVAGAEASEGCGHAQFSGSLLSEVACRPLLSVPAEDGMAEAVFHSLPL